MDEVIISFLTNNPIEGLALLAAFWSGYSIGRDKRRRQAYNGIKGRKTKSPQLNEKSEIEDERIMMK